MVFDEKEIIIGDMTKCTSDAISREKEPKKGYWRAIDYETVHGIHGTMVFAMPGDDVGELELRLELTGVYDIYLGIHNLRTSTGLDDAFREYGNLFIKCTDDYGYTRVAPEYQMAVGGFGKRIDEAGRKAYWSLLYSSVMQVYWKTERLDGQSIHIRSPWEPYFKAPVCLSYIILVPVTGEALGTFEALKPAPETRKFAPFYCSGNITGHAGGSEFYMPTDREWVREELTPFVGNDCEMLVYETVRGPCCAYHSCIEKTGMPGGEWNEDWVDPLPILIEEGHKAGLKIFSGIRMMGVHTFVVNEPFSRVRSYDRLRPYAKRDRDGNPCSNLSLAFPEVRDYWRSLIGETLEAGCDGVVLYFHRANPMIAYEKLVVESFQKKTGLDPLTLPVDDIGWNTHCAQFVTMFVREVRELVDVFPDVELGIMVQQQEWGAWENLMITGQYDLETWLSEGLLDYLFLSHNVDLDSIPKLKRSASNDLKVYANPRPARDETGHVVAKTAENFYERGIDGFCLFNAERAATKISEWAITSRLGHEKHLDYLNDLSRRVSRLVMLKTIDGISADPRYLFTDG